MREIILSLKQNGKTIFFNSHILSDVEQICDRIGILAEGELIDSGSLATLLGNEETYHVKGRGGNPDVIKQRVPNLEFENGFWQGNLQGDPQDFLASLNLMGGQILGLTLARQSLEEYFMEQLRLRGIRSSS
jgi:ABC-2 type transport system ATP-binding protein